MVVLLGEQGIADCGPCVLAVAAGQPSQRTGDAFRGTSKSLAIRVFAHQEQLSSDRFLEFRFLDIGEELNGTGCKRWPRRKVNWRIRGNRVLDGIRRRDATALYGGACASVAPRAV